MYCMDIYKTDVILKINVLQIVSVNIILCPKWAVAYEKFCFNFYM